MPFFHPLYEVKLKASKSWPFEASEDIMTKFKSQGLHIIRIKYWNASGSGSPPSLILALWNIGILLHKQNKRRTIMHTTVFKKCTILGNLDVKIQTCVTFLDCKLASCDIGWSLWKPRVSNVGAIFSNLNATFWEHENTTNSKSIKKN